MASYIDLINGVNQHWTWLVLGWVIVFGQVT